MREKLDPPARNWPPVSDSLDINDKKVKIVDAVLDNVELLRDVKFISTLTTMEDTCEKSTSKAPFSRLRFCVSSIGDITAESL